MQRCRHQSSNSDRHRTARRRVHRQHPNTAPWRSRCSSKLPLQPRKHRAYKCGPRNGRPTGNRCSSHNAQRTCQRYTRRRSHSLRRQGKQHTSLASCHSASPRRNPCQTGKIETRRRLPRRIAPPCRNPDPSRTLRISRRSYRSYLAHNPHPPRMTPQRDTSAERTARRHRSRHRTGSPRSPRTDRIDRCRIRHRLCTLPSAAKRRAASCDRRRRRGKVSRARQGAGRAARNRAFELAVGDPR